MLDMTKSVAWLRSYATTNLGGRIGSSGTGSGQDHLAYLSQSLKCKLRSLYPPHKTIANPLEIRTTKIAGEGRGFGLFRFTFAFSPLGPFPLSEEGEEIWFSEPRRVDRQRWIWCEISKWWSSLRIKGHVMRRPKWALMLGRWIGKWKSKAVRYAPV